MSERADTDPAGTTDWIPRWVVSRNLAGIVLSIAGAYGSLVFPSRVGMGLAGVSGIGAILVFTSDATNSINTAGYFFALGSWSLLALSGLATRVAIPLLLTAFWFGFTTERKLLAEMRNT